MERDAVFLRVSTPTRRLWVLVATATALLAAIVAMPATRAPMALAPPAGPEVDPQVDQPGCGVPSAMLEDTPEYTPRELESRWFESESVDGLVAELGGEPPAWENVLWLGDAQPRISVATPILSPGSHRTAWTPVVDRFGGIWLVEREHAPALSRQGRYARRVWLLPDRALFRGLLDERYRPLLVLP